MEQANYGTRDASGFPLVVYFVFTKFYTRKHKMNYTWDLGEIPLDTLYGMLF
jgi:hypothetical protein